MPTKRALIVDDSTTAQYRLKKMLRAYDLQIDAVDSGEAALLHLASHVPDVIFMDHLMPGMDGFRALQIIKSHPETAMVPVIMYTSKSGDVYTGQARALGALDVISKDTINATDLSKVMEGIHIYPLKRVQETVAEPEEVMLPDDGINPQLDISDLPPVEAVAAPAPRTEGPSSDNSRRIELRISQLEHAIDDSRRVITARLVREIQKLRYNISRELTEHVAPAEPLKKPDTPAADEAQSIPVAQPPRQGWFLPFATLAVVLIVGGFSFTYFNKLNERLSALSEQQAEQRSHLNDINNKLVELHTSLEMQSNMQTQLGVVNSGRVVKSNMLNDMVWAFNQNGAMPFNPDIMDPNAIKRLSEFVHRISQQGFKGAVWVNLSAGDFCVVTDSAGRAQLPGKDARMSDCMLLSELYTIENMMEEVVEEIDSNLVAINSVNRGDINVIVSRMDDQLLNYPTRQPQTLASEWNRVAQNNNRLTIELSDVDSLQ
jgi:CheY-like chemotaxis protein/uncharacterized coiled-coil protein SlyX